MHSADPRARNILFGLLVKLVITAKITGSSPVEIERSGCMPTAIVKEYKE